MLFNVCHKGVIKYRGRLDAVLQFLANQWGSAEKAYEIGVKVTPAALTR